MPPQQVVLGGHSQGAAIALLAALSYPHSLAGCAILAGWLSNPTVKKVRSGRWIHINNLSLPVWWGHGARDMIIPFHLQAAHSRILDDLRPSEVEQHSFDFGH